MPNKNVTNFLFVVPMLESQTVGIDKKIRFCKDRKAIEAVMKAWDDIITAYRAVSRNSFHKIINDFGYYYKAPGTFWADCTGADAVPIGLLLGGDPDEYFFITHGKIFDQGVFKEMIEKLIMWGVHG